MVEQLGLLNLIDLEIASCVHHSGPHLSSHNTVKHTATAVTSEMLLMCLQQSVRSQLLR